VYTVDTTSYTSVYQLTQIATLYTGVYTINANSIYGLFNDIVGDQNVFSLNDSMSVE